MGEEGGGGFEKVAGVGQGAGGGVEEGPRLEVGAVGLGDEGVDLGVGEGATHDGRAHIVGVPILGEEAAGGLEVAEEGRSGIGDEPSGLEGVGVAAAEEFAAEGDGAPGVLEGLPGIAEHEGDVDVETGLGGVAGALADLLDDEALVQAVESGLIGGFD